jgi:hypothetical protein
MFIRFHIIFLITLQTHSFTILATTLHFITTPTHLSLFVHLCTPTSGIFIHPSYSTYPSWSGLFFFYSILLYPHTCCGFFIYHHTTCLQTAQPPSSPVITTHITPPFHYIHSSITHMLSTLFSQWFTMNHCASFSSMVVQQRTTIVTVFSQWFTMNHCAFFSFMVVP